MNSFSRFVLAIRAATAGLTFFFLFHFSLSTPALILSICIYVITGFTIDKLLLFLLLRLVFVHITVFLGYTFLLLTSLLLLTILKRLILKNPGFKLAYPVRKLLTQALNAVRVVTRLATF